MKNFFQIKDGTFSSSNNHLIKQININLVKRGDIICLLGKSGVGKTTILRTIAGLQKLNKGIIILDNRIISSENYHEDPENRQIALSFQENSLFPHVDVLRNIEIGERNKKDENKLEKKEVIIKLKLKHLLKKYPHEISSGEAQRVSLARSLLTNPKLLLLDEPFANIDEGMKENLHIELKKILKKYKISTLIVTHDYNEAFYFGSKCALFVDHNLEQFDTPYKIYHFPKSEKVANYFNKGVFINVKVVSKFAVKHEILGVISGNFINPQQIGKNVRLLIQPEDLVHDDKSKLKFQIIDKKFIGTNFIYYLKLNSKVFLPVLVHAHHYHMHEINQEFGLKYPINIDHLVCF